jgi:hypothetical protein
MGKLRQKEVKTFSNIIQKRHDRDRNGAQITEL